ncbi:MAG TPA: serine/threonine protein kinase [Pyrinomonadaceae bacterium]|nr:serine/threonine protein kinase [Pyrinomonadaceae bacterium]
MPELKLQQSRLDGRYDIVECLGRGSYAEIYVARDNAATPGAPSTVVIKALNMSLNDFPDAELERTLVENFQNEAVALDRVRHPHIISRLGHGTAIDLSDTTFHYIVLEYLSGGDMFALSRNRPIPLDKALFYLEQVCSGLAYAHRCGVIHRDIKPQNLLLNSDRRIVKIADFGVARLEASEGAITRVGTNIYSAPEHNPLVHTGQLDTGALHIRSEQLTPAADIYSLAKTAYTLLAGESPRRFAQHPIRELPASIANEHWSQAVLRVLEKATQTQADQRYQTVLEFWDELAEAGLPPTQLLSEARHRKPSADLSVDPVEIPNAPPKAHFEPVIAATEGAHEDEVHLEGSDITGYSKSRPAGLPDYPPLTRAIEPEKRPKIVVRVDEATAANGLKTTLDRKPLEVAKAKSGRLPAHPRAPVGPRRARPFVVAAILVVAFAGMLLATHRYVTSRWNPLTSLARVSDVFVIGREGVTTTDVRLRPDASTANPPIGLAESGSRVKILGSDDNWYEVQVLEHGRAKTDPFTSDRGWINKRFVKFD